MQIHKRHGILLIYLLLEKCMIWAVWDVTGPSSLLCCKSFFKEKSFALFLTDGQVVDPLCARKQRTNELSVSAFTFLLTMLRWYSATSRRSCCVRFSFSSSNLLSCSSCWNSKSSKCLLSMSSRSASLRKKKKTNQNKIEKKNHALTNTRIQILTNTHTKISLKWYLRISYNIFKPELNAFNDLLS